MKQLEWQREVVRKEYISEEDVDVRAREILRIWQGKGLYNVGQKKRRSSRKVG
ncbi:hypothetical protein [Aeribacillus pallidus]|uniref:hypothetical protein n=1 Tax=Aeribacillus pallidus TaxID=33936 RepID=UPI003D1E52B0